MKNCYIFVKNLEDMKNIHVLPTDKPSRLFIAEKDIDMFILSDKFELGNKLCENQNIYITSDIEIKEGDWCLLNNRLVVRYFKPPVESKSFKKIILTTDQDLIKDGVQAIDDEFLEWFVKNPSCEYVEIDDLTDYNYQPDYKFYSIIIPKEEPKQETFEEAAYKFYPEDVQWTERYVFKLGAKWQSERMYSEEELIQLLIKFNQEITEVEDVREWFEQFKKK